MTQQWFDPAHYAWIPGTVYGVMAGLMGGLAGWLASRGRARTFVLRLWFTLWAASAALAIAGIVAVVVGQPWGVWFSLLLPGAVCAVVVGANSFTILKRYREIEERRLAAKDLL